MKYIKFTYIFKGIFSFVSLSYVEDHIFCLLKEDELIDGFFVLYCFLSIYLFLLNWVDLRIWTVLYEVIQSIINFKNNLINDSICRASQYMYLYTKFDD